MIKSDCVRAYRIEALATRRVLFLSAAIFLSKLQIGVYRLALPSAAVRAIAAGDREFSNGVLVHISRTLLLLSNLLLL